MCVHEQHACDTARQHHDCSGVLSPERQRWKDESKMRSHPKQEVGDWKNLYLPMSASDSSASDQLSKSCHSVRMNLRQSAACICVYEQKYSKTQEGGRERKSNKLRKTGNRQKGNKTKWTESMNT